jgi:hypothetical protein
VTRRFEKISPFLEKWPKQSPRQKNAKIETSKCNLKVRMINIKPLRKPYNAYNKSCFENTYLGKNVKND